MSPLSLPSRFLVAATPWRRVDCRVGRELYFRQVGLIPSHFLSQLLRRAQTFLLFVTVASPPRRLSSSSTLAEMVAMVEEEEGSLRMEPLRAAL